MKIKAKKYPSPPTKKPGPAATYHEPPSLEPPMPSPNSLERVLLEKVELGVRAIISPAILESLVCKIQDSANDYLSDHLIVTLKLHLIGGKRYKTQIGSVSYPKDWWQAVRARWCPAWWLKKHPVDVHTHTLEVSYQHVCPHFNYAFPNIGCREPVHLDFLKQYPYEGEYE